MKLFKYAAWFAIAMIPLMLLKRKGHELSTSGREVETDEIFDLDLKDR